MRSVFLEFHRKTIKKPFFRHFLAQNVIFCRPELPFLLLAHLFQPNGQLSCKFEHHRITTAKLRSVFLEFHRKTPKKPVFSKFFGPKRNFLRTKVSFFYYWHTFYNQMGSYPVNLSIIGLLQQSCEAFFWSFIGKPPKNPFFRHFLAQNVIFCGPELPFLLLAHLLQPDEQRFCRFEHHRITTEILRRVFLEFHRKTLKKPFFRHFLAQNVIFGGPELAFLLLAHLFQPNGQLSCKFEHHRITTAKLRSVCLEFRLKTPKNPFFRRFLAQNVFFCGPEMPLLLLAHLLQPNGQLSCKFEHHRTTTAKLRSVFLEFLRKTPKKPVFSTFFGPKRTFLRTRVTFLIISTPPTTK